MLRTKVPKGPKHLAWEGGVFGPFFGVANQGYYMGKSLRAVPRVRILFLLRFCSFFQQITLARSDFRRRKKRARTRIFASFRASGHGVSCFLAGATFSDISHEISANHLILLLSLRGLFGCLFLRYF